MDNVQKVNNCIVSSYTTPTVPANVPSPGNTTGANNVHIHLSSSVMIEFTLLYWQRLSRRIFNWTVSIVFTKYMLRTE
jgi:hypothetical protein